MMVVNGQLIVVNDCKYWAVIINDNSDSDSG